MPQENRPGHAADETLVAMRAQLAQSMVHREPVAGVEIREETLGGCPVLLISPKRPRMFLLYLHGGGFRMGSPAGIAPYLTQVADALSATVVAVKYRLAPEYPYPAALDDAVATWDALEQLAGDDGVPVMVAGDSAGGGLAASLVAKLLADGRAVPTAVVTLSAWADLRLTAASFEENAEKDSVFSLERASKGSAMYLQGHPAVDPLVSPVLADWSGAPPFLLQVGDGEVLRDDSRALAAAVIAAGGTATVEEYPGEQHVWHYAYPDTPGSRTAVESIRRWVAALLE
jgi:acetyl esterase/lipase